ncbi:MAG: amidohydrolase [Deltaproteobacteria bacterium]|nr:amidohydrolase [Deltaproteobacteria bacterium]
MIIDFHTHIWPHEIAPKVLEGVQQRAKIPFYTDGTLDGLIQSMHKAGIDKSAVSRITSRPDQVQSVNEWLSGLARPDIIPMANWLPELAVEPDLISRLKTQGFRCMKFHPDYQGFDIDDRRMYPFYEAAQADGMPILIHSGLDRGLKPPWRAMPERLAKVCRDFPKLFIIAAHMGGEDNYEDTEQYLLGKDIYLDTSFILRKMPIRTLERFIRKHSIDHIIFGSDSPWIDQTADIEYLFSLPFLSSEVKEKIAGLNAARLLAL